jgi:cell division protein FtsQ
MWSPRRPARSGVRWNGTAVKRAGKLLCWVALAGLAGWGSLIGYERAAPYVQDWLEVREVRISGIHQVTRDEIMKGLDLSHGDTQLSVSPSQMVARLEAHPWIKQVSVSRVLLHTLDVAVIERRPAALLKTSSLNLLLDAEGHVLTIVANGDDPGLPVLMGVDPRELVKGEARARDAAQTGIRLAGVLGEEFQARPEVDMGKPENMVAYVKGLRFQFGPSAFEEQWARYQKVTTLRAGAEDETGTSAGREIDLRYPGKVIVRERG